MAKSTLYGAGLVGAGAIIKTYGQIKANKAQAAEELRNAAYYREQGEFAERSGERQRRIHERDSLRLQGVQSAQFAKAGLSSGEGSASLFMAKEALFRQEEDWAIKEETDMNVRLAMLRADQSERTAADLTSVSNRNMMIAGNIVGAAAGSLI